MTITIPYRKRVAFVHSLWYNRDMDDLNRKPRPRTWHRLIARRDAALHLRIPKDLKAALMREATAKQTTPSQLAVVVLAAAAKKWEK